MNGEPQRTPYKNGEKRVNKMSWWQRALEIGTMGAASLPGSADQPADDEPKKKK
jgi:hypothetical protein